MTNNNELKPIDALNYLFNEWPKLTSIGRSCGKTHAMNCYNVIRKELTRTPQITIEELEGVYDEYLKRANSETNPWHRTELRNSAPVVKAVIQAVIEKLEES